MSVIAVISMKGGVGKTTIAAHLAVAAELGGAGPVVLIDSDMRVLLFNQAAERLWGHPARAHYRS